MDSINHISLFSGIGGIDIGLKMACPNIRTVCYVEYDSYCQGVLMSRMQDGGLDQAPIWSDVRTFDGRCWRGCVDIISGGFPCQDISISGRKEGIREGTRSGLWYEYERIICEVRPSLVFIENVANILAFPNGNRVLQSLAKIGYDAEWAIVSAEEVGAPIKRERFFLLACDNKDEFIQGKIQKIYYRENPSTEQFWETARPSLYIEALGRRYKPIPDYSGISTRFSNGLDRIACIGNSVTPQQAARAFKILMDRIKL